MHTIFNHFFMKANDLRRRYIDFFVKKYGHSEIPSASLIPENDPTVLFTTAGMHPLVPYLMGESHPNGVRLVNCQKCVRTDDIDEVGDSTHCTFFEMMGNWSLGDYFKKEAINMSYEFLTSPLDDGGLGLDPDRLSASCFEGDENAPKDEEAAEAWEELGFTRVENADSDTKRLIYFYNKKENWWGPAGQTGPCGPDTEIFYDVGIEPCGLSCQPSCSCGKYVEIWNNVFMEFNKTEEGKYEPLEQKNVDTGLGLERVTAILQGVETHYETELFMPVIEKVREMGGEISISDESRTESERIIADHLRSATFMIGDPMGITPSNTDQGYILRRSIRRAIRHGRKLGIEGEFTAELAKLFIEIYGDIYDELRTNETRIIESLKIEEKQFQKTIVHGEKEFEKVLSRLNGAKEIAGDVAFNLFETYGFPLEMTKELAKENGLTVDEKGFEEAYKKHQDLSRAGADQKFSGGLADNSEEVTKLHTATHLLHQALRDVLGDHVAQKGSNITKDRLRFDFTHDEKMTPEQKEEVERIVNEQIKRNLPITFEEMTVDEAKAQGAIGLFGDKYGEKVKVYSIGDYSKEICGGPHAKNTGELVSFKIKKEQSSSKGVRRIKAVIG